MTADIVRNILLLLIWFTLNGISTRLLHIRQAINDREVKP